MFAGSAEKNHFYSLKFLCTSYLKIKHFQLPSVYKIEHLKTKLTDLVAVGIFNFANIQLT